VKKIEAGNRRSAFNKGERIDKGQSIMYMLRRVHTVIKIKENFEKIGCIVIYEDEEPLAQLRSPHF